MTIRSKRSSLVFALAGLLGVQLATAATPWNLRGEFQTRGEIWSSPAVGPDGTVYVGSRDGNLYALGFNKSGKFVKKWSYATGGMINSSPGLGSDGSVFIAAYDNKVHALDRATGLKRWEFQAAWALWSSPALSFNGVLYIGSHDKNLYALDTSTGKSLWSVQALDQVHTSPAIDTDGTIYFGSHDKTLYAVDPASHKIKWSFTAGDWFRSSPTLLPNNQIAAGSDDGKIYFLDRSSGKKVWEFSTGYRVPSSPAVDARGRVYVGSYDGVLYALDPKAQKQLWGAKTGGEIYSSPAVAANGVIYVGSRDKQLHAIDADSGRSLWTFPAGSEVDSSPAIGPDGTVYFGSRGINGAGTLFAVQPANGAPGADSLWPKFRRDLLNTASLEDGGSPVLQLQPRGSQLNAGDGWQFTVRASGLEPIRYQWRLNGKNIPGATGATYAIPEVAEADFGNYSVVVLNSRGTSLSAPAILEPFGDYAVSDAFENPQELFDEGGTVASNKGATRQPGEPIHAPNAGGNSVWFMWEAPSQSSVIATLSTAGSTFDTILAVYEGRSVDALSRVAFSDDDGGFFTSKVVFRSTPGTLYRIAVDSSGDREGDIVMNLAFENSPADETLPRVFQPPNQTVKPGAEVRLNGDTTGGNVRGVQWFFFDQPIPNANSLTLLIPDFQPRNVGAYTLEAESSTGRRVRGVATVVEIGPDPSVQSKDKLVDLLSGVQPSEGRGSSAALAGFGGVLADLGPPLQIQAGSINNQVVNNSDASTEEREPLHCSALLNATRGLPIRPQAEGIVEIDTSGSVIPTLLSVYSGSSIDDLTTIECDPEPGTPTLGSPFQLVRFSASPAFQYTVVVDGAESARGEIHVNIKLGQPPAFLTAPAPESIFLDPGASTTLVAPAVAGAPIPAFQWVRNTSQDLGASGATFSLLNFDATKAGAYAVRARNFAGEAMSTIAFVELNTPLGIDPDVRVEDGNVQFTIHGNPGTLVVVQTSTDLSSWTTLGTVTLPKGGHAFSTPAPSGAGPRFFRVMVSTP